MSTTFEPRTVRDQMGGEAPAASRPLPRPDAAVLPPQQRSERPRERTGERTADVWLLLFLLTVAILARVSDWPDRPARRPVLRRHRVDVDRATEADLRAIPGVGPVLAAAIVAERSVGPLRSESELQRVHGIGPRLASRVAGYVRFPSAGAATSHGAAKPREPATDEARPPSHAVHEPSDPP